MAFSTFKKQSLLQKEPLTENNFCYDLAHPSFCYQEIVFPISKSVIEAIISGLEVVSLEYDWHYPIDVSTWEDNWEGVGPYFNLDLYVTKEQYPADHCGWNLQGFSGWGSPGASVELELSISPNLILSSVIDEIHPEIVNALAHEIHHLTQLSAPFQRPNCRTINEASKPLTHYRYFLSEVEVPAFVVGFRAESVFSGSPVETLMEEYLIKQVNASLITESEKKSILHGWLAHSFEE